MDLANVNAGRGVDIAHEGAISDLVQGNAAVILRMPPVSCRYFGRLGDLVSRLITFVTHVATPIIPIIKLVTKSPWPYM